MNAKLIAAFRAQRAKQSDPMSQYWPGNMRDALRYARNAVKLANDRARLPLDVPRYTGEESTALPGGDTLKIEISGDDEWHETVNEHYSVKLEECRRQYGDAPQCFEHERDWRKKFWIDRDGAGYLRTYDGDLYTVARDDYSPADVMADARKRGMPRYLVPLYMRDNIAGTLKILEEILSDRYGGGMYFYSVTLEDKDGREIDSDWCGGIDDFEYARESAEEAARYMIAKRAKETRDNIKMARNTMKVHAANIRATVAELRKVRGIESPIICATVRAHLVNVRAMFRAAIARVREAKRVRAAYRGKVCA